jgi:hypothetical protein
MRTIVGIWLHLSLARFPLQPLASAPNPCEPWRIVWADEYQLFTAIVHTTRKGSASAVDQSVNFSVEVTGTSKASVKLDERSEGRTRVRAIT